MQPTDLLTDHFRIDIPHQKALKRLRIATVEDLLYHLPARYEDISDIQSVEALEKGQEAIVYGQLSGLKSRKAWRTKRPIAEGYIEDGSAKIKIMWFNQPYLAKMYSDGMYVKIAGKVTGSEGKLYIANPEVEKLDALPVDRHDSIFKGTEAELDDTIYPVYRESKGVTSKWFYHTVLKCFERGALDNLHDPIPETILERYKLPELTLALQYIHAPKKAEYAEAARKRFAFEEVFYIQVQKALERAQVSAATTYQFKTTAGHVKDLDGGQPGPLFSVRGGRHPGRRGDVLVHVDGHQPQRGRCTGQLGGLLGQLEVRVEPGTVQELQLELPGYRGCHILRRCQDIRDPRRDHGTDRQGGRDQDQRRSLVVGRKPDGTGDEERRRHRGHVLP